jgi:hypothetical protein
MADATSGPGLVLKPWKVTGTAEAFRATKHVGGQHPDPDIDDYPLLAWQPGHDDHGSTVFTEDGAANVHDIAVAYAERPDPDALAKRFHTSVNHIHQAVAYAARAGFLGSVEPEAKA